jgi:hypothetical protein
VNRDALRAGALASLALAALAWIAPSAAFDGAQVGARAISADVKADASAYDAPYFPSCSGLALSPKVCNVFIYDNATATQTFTATKQTDAQSIVSSFTLDGNAPVSGTATGASKSVGQSSTLAITINACALSCGSRTADFILTGSGSGIAWREEHVTFTVVYP